MTNPNRKPTAALVQNFPLFADVAPSDRTTIVSLAREEYLARRQRIFSEGDAIEHVIVLLSGSVKITQTGPNGNPVIIRFHGPGEVIGTFLQGASGKHYSTAQAVRSCTALVWDARTFEDKVEPLSAIRRNAIHALEARLQEMEKRFREVATAKVGPRLSNELIRLANQLGEDVKGRREINLSRLELAQLTGMGLSTVSRLLSKWQSLGIVSVRREVVQILDFEALTRISATE